MSALLWDQRDNITRIVDAVEKIAKNTTPPEQVENAALLDVHLFYYDMVLEIVTEDNALKKAQLIRDMQGKTTKAMEALTQR